MATDLKELEAQDLSNFEDSTVRAEKWQPLVGLWDKKGMSYLGPEESNATQQYGVSRSSYRFRDGTIYATITLTRNEKTTGAFIIGFQGIDRPYTVIGLGAFIRAYSITEFRPDFGWKPISQAGPIKNLQSNHSYSLEIRVEGQRIRMTVDDVDVLETVLHHPLEGTGLCLFAFHEAKVTFKDIELIRLQPKAFVAMPFSGEFDTLYDDVIKPVATDLRFEILRVDEISGPGIILDDIRRQIESAQVVVAEVSQSNPNVFYEIGYAHALGKPVILLARKEPEKQLPFDIRPYRAIYYDNTIGGKKIVEETLRRHLSALQRDF